MKSPLRWIGGKSRLYKEILEIFPKHKCYVEVFGGGLWVFFNKQKCSVECVNDISTELMNFYFVIQTQYFEFKQQCEYLIPSREVFDNYLNLEFEDLSKLERAVRFFYINRTCFGGNMVDSPNFATSNVRRSNLCCITDDFSKFMLPIHQRLKDTYIENMDFRKLINKFDSKETLFYLDPPYIDMRGYETEFTKLDHIELEQILSNINGKFVLSINNTDFTIDLYKNYNVYHKSQICKVAQKGEDMKEQKELLICNFAV